MTTITCSCGATIPASTPTAWVQECDPGDYRQFVLCPKCTSSRSRPVPILHIDTRGVVARRPVIVPAPRGPSRAVSVAAGKRGPALTGGRAWEMRAYVAGAR